ncbi:glycosyltransferase family 33 protein [Bipolaris oryzae ATCC 44560]|uniref:Chitobiosyldiphosphodolichol beta-mannosyltransferase n=1 Tax=Bipolaris oryzae ATCC 44560 TaxID=930090 RepID=W6ZVX9_COCMI|nr:glycosyltransferase family 33 protein [Bipolaris oryzae ATCC 44560]EUC47956.1 glycosyltransferase family 33 protein [Bipolaris oryzae ATCC 44560]
MLDDTLEAAADKYAPLFSLVLTVVVVLSTLFTLLLVTLPGQYDPYKDKSLKFVDEHGKEVKPTTRDGKEPPQWKNARSVQVVVLGDIGRSPRMQYHALSLAKHGARVTLIGYQESEILPEIVSNPLIEIIPLSPAPASLRSSSRLLFPILAPLKVLWQIFSLYTALGYRSQPARWTLVQNPPSIPTLAVASLVCFLRRTDLVIDWHNFGYSILAMKLGDSHPLVRISERHEKIFAKAASHHITVTDAMARVLKVDYGVTAQALHDRPASAFQPIGAEERAKFLKRLPETAEFAKDLSPSSKTPWKLIVSATSWTADEDFSLLLSALVTYSAECTSKTYLPRILAIITGKGPQKEYYLSKINELNQQKKLQNVIIKTAWLTHADYALLLASADLGVSLHTSSSGVDLPMKVVDMFGAGLPVVGWGKFEAWPELVKQGVNGLGFQSPEELALHLATFFGSDSRLRETLKVGALKESEHRWDDEWDGVGGKLFKLI